MKLQRLLDECIEALTESAYEEYTPDDILSHFGATVNTNDGYIDLWMTRQRGGHYTCEVTISHDDLWKNTAERYSRNFEDYLSKELDDCVDWDALQERFEYDNETEWEAHGFRDEADFWKWKEG